VSASYLPPRRVFPGAKSIWRESLAAPLSEESSEMPATSWMPLRCCACRPGLARPPRILAILMGRRRSALRPTDMRRIWPPPSIALPSISRKS